MTGAKFVGYTRCVNPSVVRLLLISELDAEGERVSLKYVYIVYMIEAVFDVI
jgi:hypothetical protein